MAKQEKLVSILQEELRSALVEAINSRQIVSRAEIRPCNCRPFDPKQHMSLVAANDDEFFQKSRQKLLVVIVTIVALIFPKHRQTVQNLTRRVHRRNNREAAGLLRFNPLHPSSSR